MCRRARALAVGQWIEWQGDEDVWIRGKLSWRSEVTSNCIFVNRKGMKVEEMTLHKVAALFRAQRALILDDLNTPLMDRALNAMLGALNDTGGEAKPA